MWPQIQAAGKWNFQGNSLEGSFLFKKQTNQYIFVETIALEQIKNVWL